MEPQITLKRYEEKFKDSLLSFQLPDVQAQFTGLPEETLDDALLDPNKCAVVIALGDTAVGFFILHTGISIRNYYNNYSTAVLLRAFLVDHASQGKGYAGRAMALLPAFVRSNFPAVNEVVLLVNERNGPADRLYTRSGFVDCGLRRVGAKGTQKILTLALDSSYHLQQP
ncbi:GNAT family N-acetyltransferase [Paenibacillus albidus]|uniref:GNAT family N-acetyltransferase n=1 Tax=Paenibacillus albidus TaxID=2041023 RepID=UPI001BE79720|nr:GNAT family N-acetyltransferase [Paenibacillus albidus]MBT2289810.1 GNAT family N-acetyltransferase [Paenibacillus albidus]